MKGVYNKEALNRIASQDRLDRMIVLVSPSTWVAIIGGFVLITALLIWGFFGKLPTSVDSTGIFMNTDGMDLLYSQTEGFVTEVYVTEDQEVKEGDPIAALGTEEDVYKIKQLDTRIQQVENMTFDSELDEVTSDTEKMADIKMNAQTIETTSKKTAANLELKKEKLKDLEDRVEEKEALMLKYKEKYYATLNIVDQQDQLAYQEADEDYSKHFSLYEQYKSTYISAQEQYNAKKTEFDAKYASFDTTTATEDELASYNAALADLEAAKSQAGDAKTFMEQEEQNVKDANSALDTARKAYLEYLNSQSGTTASNTIASTEYSEALQDYVTVKSEYQSLVDEIDNLELQAVLDEDDAELNYDKYEQEFDNEKSIVLNDLKNQRENLLHSADQNVITAVEDGKIYDLLVCVGDAVSKGGKVAELMAGDLSKNSVICYAPLTDAKKVEAGMEVHVFPTSVDKNEYGHILGTVVSVDNHVASNYDMLDQLGDQSLVNDFTTQGAVQKIVVELESDPSTISGYKWNSVKGADVTLSTGTMVELTVITENKRPIDVLIPYIKKKLSFEETEDASTTGTTVTQVVVTSN